MFSSGFRYRVTDFRSPALFFRSLVQISFTCFTRSSVLISLPRYCRYTVSLTAVFLVVVLFAGAFAVSFTASFTSSAFSATAFVVFSAAFTAFSTVFSKVYVAFDAVAFAVAFVEFLILLPPHKPRQLFIQTQSPSYYFA